MAKINGYYTSADVMKKKITNLYASKIGGDRPLDKAKADIEAEYMMVIPLAVSEVQKVEPSYSFQQRGSHLTVSNNFTRTQHLLVA